jgi:thiol:disulfide interchange protein DsbD
MNELAQHFQQYISGAPLLAFATAFVVGVLTSLTPCVYPMIPITAAYIGGSSSGGGRARGLLLSICYVLGLSLMYSALGATAALTGGIFGSFASSPYVNLVLANIFILLGLSMLDVFVIPTPKFLSVLSARKKGGGYAGAFLIGLAAAFIATPCTTPVVLAILTIVAKRQNVFYGASLLFVFSLGLGLLLVVVGTFAGALAALPKSGIWMEKIKRFFGWLMIACAEYFLVQAGKMWL